MTRTPRNMPRRPNNEYSYADANSRNREMETDRHRRRTRRAGEADGQNNRRRKMGTALIGDDNPTLEPPGKNSRGKNSRGRRRQTGENAAARAARSGHGRRQREENPAARADRIEKRAAANTRGEGGRCYYKGGRLRVREGVWKTTNAMNPTTQHA